MGPRVKPEDDARRMWRPAVIRLCGRFSFCSCGGRAWCRRWPRRRDCAAFCPASASSSRLRYRHHHPPSGPSSSPLCIGQHAPSSALTRHTPERGRHPRARPEDPCQILAAAYRLAGMGSAAPRQPLLPLTIHAASVTPRTGRAHAPAPATPAASAERRLPRPRLIDIKAPDTRRCHTTPIPQLRPPDRIGVRRACDRGGS